MERKVVVLSGVITAVVPLLIVWWAHTSWWPEIFAMRTDTFIPRGPSLVFSDFVPSDRTGPIKKSGDFFVRPIMASPIYLLFLPRRHSRLITVELIARPTDGLSPNTKFPLVSIGYRHGDKIEDNILTAVAGEERAGWWVGHAVFPLTEMTEERGDARRLVFVFAHNNDRVWEIKSARIFYEK